MSDTNQTQALQVMPQQTGVLAEAASCGEIVEQVRLIQNVMQQVMREGEHYGKIPGCGNKPSLLKPGAEKLGFTFRLAPEFVVIMRALPHTVPGHREYEVNCTLKSILSGRIMGSGVGSCSTMEGKYRYRAENTGQEVPKAYWDKRDRSMLGGEGYTTRKVDGKWLIYHQEEHNNPADYYNTVLKMAKKRAHVDAILTATAASDIFTQDVEDLPEAQAAPASVPTVSKPVEKNESKPIETEAKILVCPVCGAHDIASNTREGITYYGCVICGGEWQDPPAAGQPPLAEATQQALNSLESKERTFGEAWKPLIVPFGKDADRKFGDLDKKDLWYWVMCWAKKPLESREWKGKVYPPKAHEVRIWNVLNENRDAIKAHYKFSEPKDI